MTALKNGVKNNFFILLPKNNEIKLCIRGFFVKSNIKFPTNIPVFITLPYFIKLKSLLLQ